MTGTTFPGTRALARFARAAVYASLIAGSAGALAGPINIVANPTGGVDSHINVDGTNWGGTTFFNVANLPIAGYGTYSHVKDDAGRARGVATVDILAPDDNSASIVIAKSGFANVAGGGAWSNVQGAVYLDIVTDATFSASHQILAGSRTRYQFSLKKYDAGSDTFGLVYGTESSTQTGRQASVRTPARSPAASTSCTGRVATTDRSWAAPASPMTSGL